MPESFMNFTEGSGKKAHTFQRTIGANNVEDEVILQGEPYLATYMVGADQLNSTATAGKHLMQLMAGASLKVRVRRIELWQQTAATTGGLLDLRLVRLTTAGTGGTAIVPQAMDTADAAAGATAMSLPTVNGSEAGVAMARIFPYMIQTVGASTPLITPMGVWDFDRPRSKPLIIQAGVANGIAIRVQAAVAGGVVNVSIIFDETNF